MNNTEASCVFYIKVGMFTHLEQSKTSLLTGNKLGIVRLTVQHDLIVSVSSMYYHGDSLRQTSADVLSLEHCPIYSWQSCNFSCRTPQFIPVNKQTTTDWHIVHLGLWKTPATCSYKQQNSSWVYRTCWQLIIPFGREANHIILKTSHFFSLSSSSPIPQQ